MKTALIFFILVFCFFIYGERFVIKADACNSKNAKINQEIFEQTPENMKSAIYKDFAEFSEDDWVPVSGPGYDDPGKFIQKEGFIQNYYPGNTDTSVMFHNATGYAMRMLKGITARNGKAETELMLMGFAAPSILVRSKISGNKNYESYYCVIFNQSTAQKKYEGINLWVYRGEWTLLKGIDLDVPRNIKIKFAVEFTDQQLTFFYNNTNVGSVSVPEPASPGSVGIVSMEGPNRFYNFRFTRYD